MHGLDPASENGVTRVVKIVTLGDLGTGKTVVSISTGDKHGAYISHSNGRLRLPGSSG